MIFSLSWIFSLTFSGSVCRGQTITVVTEFWKSVSSPFVSPGEMTFFLFVLVNAATVLSSGTLVS